MIANTQWDRGGNKNRPLSRLWARLCAAVVHLVASSPCPRLLRPRVVQHRMPQHEAAGLKSEQFLRPLVFLLPAVCVIKSPTRPAFTRRRVLRAQGENGEEIQRNSGAQGPWARSPRVATAAARRTWRVSKCTMFSRSLMSSNVLMTSWTETDRGEDGEKEIEKAPGEDGGRREVRC